jgi:hypothetical protein
MNENGQGFHLCSAGERSSSFYALSLPTAVLPNRVEDPAVRED